MITYEKLLPEDILPPESPFFLSADISPEDLIFFDIETTGFKPAYSGVYLIGVVYHTSKGWMATQWMGERISEESMLLRIFDAFSKPYKMFVHFNGDRFDIPYLTEKYEQYGLESPFSNSSSSSFSSSSGSTLDSSLGSSYPGKLSKDIYKDLRCLKPLFNLTKMNQKSFEELTGLYREDPFTGGELIEKYKMFAKSRDPQLKEMLLLHNLEDIIGMLKITSLYAYPEMMRCVCAAKDLSSDDAFTSHQDDDGISDYSNHDGISGNEVGPIARHLLATLTSAYQENQINEQIDRQIDEQVAGQIVLTGKLPFICPVEVDASHASIAHYHLSIQKDTVTLTVPVVETCLKFFFDNPKDYYYLPLEDMAIHKSVASFVEKDFRKRATKETCYTRKEGRFVPHVSGHGDMPGSASAHRQNIAPAFRSGYKAKDLWMEYPDDLAANKGLQQQILLAGVAALLDVKIK